MPMENIPSGVFVLVHPKEWMDKYGVKLWLDKLWSWSPGGLLKEGVLLVWDQFRAHKTENTKKRVEKLRT